MKRVLFLLAFLAVLLLVVSCVKPEPPKPPAVFYTASTIVKSGKGSVVPDKLSGITPGSNVDLKFIPESGYSIYSVKVNGIKVDEITPSAAEVSYTVRDIKSNITVEVIFIETYNLLISILNPPLKFKAMDVYKEDGTYLFSFSLTQEEKNRRKYFYYPEGKTETLNPDGSVSFSADWSISQNTLRVAAMYYTIIELTSTKLVYKAPPVKGSDGTYTYAVYTYERI